LLSSCVEFNNSSTVVASLLHSAFIHSAAGNAPAADSNARRLPSASSALSPILLQWFLLQITPIQQTIQPNASSFPSTVNPPTADNHIALLLLPPPSIWRRCHCHIGYSGISCAINYDSVNCRLDCCRIGGSASAAAASARDELRFGPGGVLLCPTVRPVAHLLGHGPHGGAGLPVPALQCMWELIVMGLWQVGCQFSRVIFLIKIIEFFLKNIKLNNK
jgi:hypothetical protein